MTLIPPSLAEKLQRRIELWHLIVAFALTVVGVVASSASAWTTVRGDVDRNAANIERNASSIGRQEDKLDEIGRTLGRIEGKLDGLR